MRDSFDFLASLNTNSFPQYPNSCSLEIQNPNFFILYLVLCLILHKHIDETSHNIHNIDKQPETHFIVEIDENVCLQNFGDIQGEPQNPTNESDFNIN